MFTIGEFKAQDPALSLSVDTQIPRESDSVGLLVIDGDVAGLGPDDRIIGQSW
ncbi:hypothetical protein [Loktanella sp. M215]|uniref:hypothetical protein n=1 Tax=Loktanella sp. M215 TaxID=2675431 RepID=UPI001F463640|nr:hypothetical protein [Loktanella sp. M215]MCF7699652.1 hypothetical protein [Loktanella sp. M215]